MGQVEAVPLQPSNASKKLINLHSWFMIAAFLVILPIGGFYTRYYKSWTPLLDVPILSLPRWLWVHIISQFSGLVMMLRGLECIRIARTKEALTKKPHEWTLHGQIGIFIIAFHLAFFIFFLLFRTKTIKPFRWKFRLLLHQNLSHTVDIFTLYLLNTVHHMVNTGMTCSSVSLVRIWTLFFILSHTFMSMYFDLIKVLKRVGLKPKYPNKLTAFQTVFHSSYQTGNQPWKGLRGFLLLLFILITTGFGVSVWSTLDIEVIYPNCKGFWNSFHLQ